MQTTTFRIDREIEIEKGLTDGCRKLAIIVNPS
jgi:hypothetical protein